MVDAYGLEAGTCPHCGGTTRIEEDANLRWVCAACGGPRIPAPSMGGAPLPGATGNEVEPLRDARRALLGAARARGLAWVQSLFAASLFAAGAVTLGLGLGIGHGVALAVVLFAVGVISTVGALSQRANVKRRTNEATARIDEAWGRVAEDVLRASNTAGRDLTAPELAKILRLREPDAEALLSSLAVHDRARIDIGADAELHYASTDVAPTDVAANDDDAAATDDDAARAARGAR